MNTMTDKVKDIGINVNPPKDVCNDPDCPFHGSLSVRGQVIDGTVVSVKMNKNVVVERNYLKYHQKYERYEKRSNKYTVHAAPCMNLNVGDEVTIMECRPISKTVSFVVIEKRE